MPKVVDHEKRRELIVQKGLDLFVSQGLSSTHLSDIARACGISRTIIYHYFSNKEQILLYAVQLLFDDIEDSYKVIDKDESLAPDDKLKQYIMIIVESCHERMEVLIPLIRLWVKAKKQRLFSIYVLKRFRFIKKTFKKLLSKGVSQGLFRPLDVPETERILLFMVKTHISGLVISPEYIPDEVVGPTFDFIDSLKENILSIPS